MGLREDFLAAMREVNDELAGDPVTAVSPAGVEIELICLATDMDTDDREGLVIDAAGWKVPTWRRLDFNREYLEEKGVTITPDWHFLIAGERWDLIEGEPILTHQGPLAGAQPIISVRVRRAAELERSTPGDEFTFG